MQIDPPPLAPWVSAEARARFAAGVLGARSPAGDLAAVRAHYDRFNRERAAVARRLFDVTVEDTRLGDVPVTIVQPATAPRSDRLLICLHGGAFMWGSGAGALVEAIPMAATAGCTVIAVDYRLAPEHAFPAAVDDVLACWAAVVADRPASTVGMFGCSAGGILTAQVTARLLREGRPAPGALAMLHGTGLEIDGDSAATSGPLCGIGHADVLPGLASLPYFRDADPADPLVFPGGHPAVLARFPPSLLITGTRDFAASSLATMHRRLLAAGVAADLVVFDGMWHAHHVDTDLPEAAETFALMAGFFAERLG